MRIQDILSSSELKNSSAMELYRYTGTRHSVHTDFIKYLDISLSDLHPLTEVEYSELMDFDGYSSTIEANSSDGYTEEEFKENYPNGVLVIVLSHNTNEILLKNQFNPTAKEPNTSEPLYFVCENGWLHYGKYDGDEFYTDDYVYYSPSEVVEWRYYYQ